jgi:hypothetical protein
MTYSPLLTRRFSLFERRFGVRLVARYQPDVCPVGAISSEEVVLDGSSKTKYNSEDQSKATTTRFSSSSAGTSFAD